MDKKTLKAIIEVAAGRQKADLVIKNSSILDLGCGRIRQGDIAIVDGYIAGTGESYEGDLVLDARGLFALPGLIDAHIHIESSYLSPEEFARLVIPHGTTTVIADPHEIANVAGLDGVRYMLQAAEKTPLKIEYMLPSCVPSTPFEHAGAELLAEDLKAPLASEDILGLAEFMNVPGVIYCDDEALDKIIAAKAADKPVDGHSPGLSGKALNAYASAGILADHECGTVEEMEERLQKGMYVMLRYGSSCHDLINLLPAVNERNARRCLLCSDDRHAKTMLEDGHLNEHLQLCVKEGLDPVIAVQMASLNTAEAFGLKDRGAIFPGRKADLVLVRDLQDFKAEHVFIDGNEVARRGNYLLPVERADASLVRNSFHIKDLHEDRLRFRLKKEQVYAIEIIPGSVVTKKAEVSVELDESGDIVFSEGDDLCRLAVIERHKARGTIGLGLLKNYGLKYGAIASSIAHDSHNIMLAGRDPKDMLLAARSLVEQEGGVVLVRDGAVLARLPLPIAGLMSQQPAENLIQDLAVVQDKAHSELAINEAIDPVMTLSFMSLAVIPELKLTDLGLFDVQEFRLIDMEVATN